ncbi:hypothetical protein [Edaphobacter dinghuensis]|uniref:Uncharacterized protein n=1 Tax=Edaphobacter dinghuensis TaxID=1560005 RepID=A0A917M8Z5_9BACT|nr:hypothetical protein [Edaphobacter dinghuensis]GGG85005.1 hypothetical protein GCM10011585_31020 [Edaphobacter dinghuensis]
MKHVLLERISIEPPFEAAVLKTEKLPLDAEAGERLSKVLLPWLQELAEAMSLEHAMWLQGAELHRNGAVDLLVSHGAKWMPDIGLGIRPDGEPPRMLRADDFRKRRWNDPVKLKHETAFHLAGGAVAAKSAIRLLCGSGTVLYCLLDAPIQVYLAEQRELWLPTIQEPAFRAHPFYMPFFDAKGLENKESSRLMSWMGRARLYLRESSEDEGIVIVTSIAGALDLLQDRYAEACH